MQAMMNNEQDFIGPVNLGNPGEFTMKQLAELVLELTGAKSKIVHLPRPTDDPTQRRPDITLAKKKLNWEPKVSLREGLKKTIEYFKGIRLSDFRRPTDFTAHKRCGT
jgi:UDP-glucuronate decarboxylase